MAVKPPSLRQGTRTPDPPRAERSTAAKTAELALSAEKINQHRRQPRRTDRAQIPAPLSSSSLRRVCAFSAFPPALSALVTTPITEQRQPVLPEARGCSGRSGERLFLPFCSSYAETSALPWRTARDGACGGKTPERKSAAAGAKGMCQPPTGRRAAVLAAPLTPRTRPAAPGALFPPPL